jgi:3-hydroxyacyl-CoA dehydrogenase/enoyl-CoA hydratase/3-hydroxybutyryl-CoA epimerase
MRPPPQLEQFRIELSEARVAHLIFDMPGRSMNVFSNAAIVELGAFAAWLKTSDVAGCVVRSGKASAFCAGADLAELSEAYDMITAAPKAARHQVAFDHFFRLSQAIRALETAGKPVAAAVTGLALGGGCELALGAHYRVLADDPRAAMGLPESLVGLLPGAGGTQRLPRLIGVGPALPILLDGARLAGAAALSAGLVHALAPPAEAVARAEAWVLSPDAVSQQPWDGSEVRSDSGWRAAIRTRRAEVLQRTLGHEPAPLAILDCVEHGLPETFDRAIRVEMDVFSQLIQRREPRNMIRTLFVAKQERDKAIKRDAVPPAAISAAAQLSSLILLTASKDPELAFALARAGFRLKVQADASDALPSKNYWFDDAPDDARKRSVRALLDNALAVAQTLKSKLSREEQRIADVILVEDTGFPAYLGGPFAMLEDRAH